MYKWTIKKIKSVYNNLLLYFTNIEELETKSISKFNYTYTILKDYNKNIISIDIDLAEAIKTIKNILKNDFNNPDAFVDIPKIKDSSYIEQRLLYWISDNTNMFSNPNEKIQEFNILSKQLIEEYDRLVKLRNEDTSFMYNIRILKPYIINLVDIRKILLDVYNKENVS